MQEQREQIEALQQQNDRLMERLEAEHGAGAAIEDSAGVADSKPQPTPATVKPQPEPEVPGKMFFGPEIQWARRDKLGSFSG